MKPDVQISDGPPHHGEEMEGARRASGISSPAASSISPGMNPTSDPEVLEKPVRRKFTADYKLKIVQEADSCTAHGQIGALLRREGLYSSHLSTWRRQLRRGTLQALSPKKRGPQKQSPNPLAQKVARLEKENQRLFKKLKQAETIIEVQKKISELMEIPLDKNTGETS